VRRRHFNQMQVHRQAPNPCVNRFSSSVIFGRRMPGFSPSVWPRSFPPRKCWCNEERVASPSRGRRLASSAWARLAGRDSEISRTLSAALMDLRSSLLASRLRRVDLPRPPNVIHALRTQPEGIASLALIERYPHAKLALSTWGQDFVLLAASSRTLRNRTRDVVSRADLLIADNPRDLRLARDQFGLRTDAVGIVMSAQVGVETAVLAAIAPRARDRTDRSIKVLIGRGVESAYHRLRVAIDAVAFAQRGVATPIELVVALPPHRPEVARQVQGWLHSTGLSGDSRVVFPDRDAFLAELAGADIYLFVTTQDGLPMSMIEAMSLRVVPVAAWSEAYCPPLEDGVTGFVASERSVKVVGETIIRACLSAKVLREVGERARERVVSQFDIADQSRLLRDTYRRIVDVD
jgi:glycosyltransferase involved in cell wall biosynthesis